MLSRRPERCVDDRRKLSPGDPSKTPEQRDREQLALAGGQPLGRRSGCRQRSKRASSKVVGVEPQVSDEPLLAQQPTETFEDRGLDAAEVTIEELAAESSSVCRAPSRRARRSGGILLGSDGFALASTSLAASLPRDRRRSCSAASMPLRHATA